MILYIVTIDGRGSDVFRLSKITDYGILVLAHLARQPSAATQNAREIASAVELPLPVVSKVLKALARAGVLESRRGSKGGFALTRRPEELSVSEVIEALDGPVALTECSGDASLCQHEGSCAVRVPLQVINKAVENTLATITLAELIHPAFPAMASPLCINGAELFSLYPGPRRAAEPRPSVQHTPPAEATDATSISSGAALGQGGTE